MPAPKRKLADVDSPFSSPSTVKVKLEGETADYSQDVKRKLNAASRTSTACDRCRVRKMRCDDQPEGCKSCLLNQQQCKTTDRITGKATVRGYVENLERRIQELESHSRQLQERVISLGGDVKTDDQYVDPVARPLLGWQENERTGEQRAGADCGPGRLGSDKDTILSQIQGVTKNSALSANCHKDTVRLPDFRSGLSGNNYLGVSTSNALLSSIRGTTMNVLGMEIDLANYMSADLDEPENPSHAGEQHVYNKSYRAFIHTAFGTNPRVDNVELPSRSDGLNYALVFFKVTNPYLPIIHRPSLMATITRIYDDPAFEPSVAEKVMVHTVFAIMHLQYAARASRDDAHQKRMNRSSNLHYHYALSFFPELMASHTLADAQALALLCLHVRNFPKPGACWMLTSITLNLAIEMGLNRSTKSWAAATMKRNVLEIEIRKRVFWSILVIHVVVSGNLGRPLALRSDDWDVEMPEMVDDDLLGEAGIDCTKPGKCNFMVGLQAMLAVPIYMDLYNSIYVVKRSPARYIDTVRGLERRLNEFNAQLPPELHESAATDEMGRVHAHYLAIWQLHIRLLLRHPSLSLTTAPEFNNENLTVSLEVSQKILYHVRQVQKYQSLDGTWQTGALFLLAIATTLFVHWERRDQLTQSSLAALREEMRSWLSIIVDMANLLGSGRALQDTVRATMEKTLGMLTQHLASKNGSSSLPSTKQNFAPSQSMPQVQPSIPNHNGQPANYASYPEPHNNNDILDSSTASRSPYLTPPTIHSNPNSIPYHNATQYQYHTPYPNDNSLYENPSYPQPNAISATAAAANTYMQDFQPHHDISYHQDPSYPNASTYHSSGGPSSWRDFMGNMSLPFEPGAEYLSSASALMQLGGHNEGLGLHGLQPVVDLQQHSDMSGQIWPFMNFDSGSQGA